MQKLPLPGTSVTAHLNLRSPATGSRHSRARASILRPKTAGETGSSHSADPESKPREPERRRMPIALRSQRCKSFPSSLFLHPNPNPNPPSTSNYTRGVVGDGEEGE